MEGKKVLQAGERTAREGPEESRRLLQGWDVEWKTIGTNMASHPETTFGEHTLRVHFKMLSRKLQNHLSDPESFDRFSKQCPTPLKEI